MAQTPSPGHLEKLGRGWLCRSRRGYGCSAWLRGCSCVEPLQSQTPTGWYRSSWGMKGWGCSGPGQPGQARNSPNPTQRAAPQREKWNERPGLKSQLCWQRATGPLSLSFLLPNRRRLAIWGYKLEGPEEQPGPLTEGNRPAVTQLLNTCYGQREWTAGSQPPGLLPSEATNLDFYVEISQP